MRQYVRFIVLLLLGLVFQTQSLVSQSIYDTGDCNEFAYRVFQLGDTSISGPSFLIRPVACPDPITILNDSTHWANYIVPTQVGKKNLPYGFSVRPLDVFWFNSYNTTVPRGANDGAIWQGAGYNTALSGGVHLNNDWLHIRVNPVIGMAQNRSFDNWPDAFLRNQSKYSFPLRRIDHVQRYGDDLYTWLDPGDSYLEVRKFGLKAGFGSQRIWAGPALFNPLLYSYNAPGFPKLYVGTQKPLETRVGGFEFSYHFGAIKESSYFDSRNSNNLYAIQSLQFVYSPSFIKGLSVGVIRNYIEDYPTTTRGFIDKVRKIVDPFYKTALITEDNPTGDDPDDQIATIMGRWLISEYGFEIYAEYGRNDHSTNWEDFIVQPDHDRAYLFGFLKTFQAYGKLIAIGFENTVLDGTRNSFTKIPPGREDEYRLFDTGRWYYHDKQMGFVNKGQILGSGIGMGSNSRTLHATILDTDRRTHIKLSQIHYYSGLLHIVSSRNVILANNEPGTKLWEVQPTEFLLGISHTRHILWGMELSATIEQSFIMNQYFIKKNDIWNTRFEMVVRMPLKGVFR